MAIKLLVDSSTDISKVEAEKLGINMLSMFITFDGTDYLDGVDLLPEDFYKKLRESSVLPKTSQIVPARFEEAFAELTKDGDELLVITLSSKLSGTYASACAAAEGFGGKVCVVDSLNAAIGERLLAQYAMQLIERGTLSLQEIASELDEKKTRIRLYALLNTLEYLKKGGRISAATAIAGEVLSIKPIISVIDGEVKVVGKAMGARKGNMMLKGMYAKTNGADLALPYGMVYSGEDIQAVETNLKDCAKVFASDGEGVPAYAIGATIGTHVGPGVVGLAYFEK